MSNGPRQPLEERDAEIEQLRRALAYVGRCLDGDYGFYSTYVHSIAAYAKKHAGDVEISDEFISEQTMDRVYDAVQASLDKEDHA